MDVRSAETNVEPSVRPPGGSGLVLVGDVHGHYEALARRVAALPRTVAVVQVGDLGPLAAWAPLDRPVYFVRGNHDDLPALRGLATPAEVRPGLVYLPAGVYALGGMRVGALGGAESVDGPARARGVDWWPDEEGAQPEEFDRLLAAARISRGVDVLVTHTPPALVVGAMLRTPGPPGTSDDEAPHAGADGGAAHGGDPPADERSIDAAPSAVRVEQAWRMLGQPPLVCGHMHRPWRDGVVEVLGFLGVTLRTLWRGQVRRPGGIR